jgi:hypothetical protein
MKVIFKMLIAVLIFTASAFTTYYIGTYWDVWLYVAKDIYKVGYKDAMYEYNIKWGRQNDKR